MTESPEQKDRANSSESSQPILKRRQFIGAGAAAAAALILPKTAKADNEIAQSSVKIAQASTECAPTTLTLPSDCNFFQPNVISSTAGTLTSDLDIYPKPYSDLKVDDPQTYVRAFKQAEPPIPPNTEPLLLPPAPTLCVYPGDQIKLKVSNQLEPNTKPPTSELQDSTYCPKEHDMNHPNCFNTTNMHFHGLHVSPMSVGEYPSGEPVYISSGDPKVKKENITLTESSDDVLYELEPGETHSYCPWLPAFHAPGTHWYHSHRHGSTAIQVAGGMVGAIIVKEPKGQEICPEAPDVVMMIQEQPQSLTEKTGKTNYINDLTPQERLDRGIYERKGNQESGKFLVNGANKPTLNLQEGEIQRWRLVNANSTPRAFMGLELRKGDTNAIDADKNPNGELQTLYRIAVDGITLYGKQMDHPSVKFDSSRKDTSIPFALGNRVDLLVNLKPGTYTLWKRKDNTNAPNLSSSLDEALATIKVDGTTTFANATKVAASFQNLLNNGIPTTAKPDYLKPIEKIDRENTTPVLFQTGGANLEGVNRLTTPGRGKFQISNTQYKAVGEKSKNTLLSETDKISDSGIIESMIADLGSTQEWIIANNSGAAHPFHVHVNPFLVVATADINDITFNPNGNIDSTQEIYQKLKNASWTPTSVAQNGIDPDIWWDTFTIAPNKAYKIQHRFDDYWGNFVLHCHVLIHEDQGMMWNVKVNNVCDKGTNPCQQLLEPVVVSSADLFSTGTKIALQADTGKWLSRCNNCQQTVGNNYPDTITVHIDNPDSSNPYAQFEVLDVGGGKIALKADTGKYVARCRDCIINGAYPDFLTVHVDDPSLPYAQFTPEPLDNGKYALKADTGKYVARCRNCSTGAAYSDTVTIHVDDPTNAPYAQWNIQCIK